MTFDTGHVIIARRYVSKTELLSQYLDFQEKTLPKDRGKVLTPEIDNGKDQGNVLTHKIDQKIDRYNVFRTEIGFLLKQEKLTKKGG